jgi:hypothetical protein
MNTIIVGWFLLVYYHTGDIKYADYYTNKETCEFAMFDLDQQLPRRDKSWCIPHYAFVPNQ